MWVVHPALESISWLPYRFFSSIRDTSQNRTCLDLTKYGINKRFWLSFPPHDEGLSRQLKVFGFREPLNCRCYVDFVDNSDTLLDIGSNIGFFAILGGNARRIVCVEPLTSVIELLHENIRQNNLQDKCEVIQAAVGAKGRMHLEVPSHLNLSRIVSEKSERTIEVESIPLAELIEEHPANLIRLDVEGYEYDILYEQVPASINKISVEFHTSLLGDEKSGRLLSYLRDEGFRARYFVEDVPLRLYPFVHITRSASISRLTSYVEHDLDIEDIRDRVFRGRSLKYLHLQR